MLVILHSYMGHTLMICGARRIEQDHLFWYIWSGNKLEPEIISKGAGKLTIEEIETT